MKRAERRQRQRDRHALVDQIRREHDVQGDADTTQGWLDAIEMAGFYFEFVGEGRWVYAIKYGPDTEMFAVMLAVEGEPPFLAAVV